MKQAFIWTYVLVLFFITTDFVLASMKPSELKVLRRDVATKKANCEKTECEDMKLLKSFDEALKDLTKSNELVDLLKQENLTLREQAKTLQKSQPLQPTKECKKKEIFSTKMKELGINENGSLIYNKSPIKGANAQCWANNKKKKDATVVLCEFPLAVNILTKGGRADRQTEMGVQYMFALNSCDLIAVKLTEKNPNFEKETHLSAKTCVEQWNKRGSDATMTKEQQEIMEETIQECFKYQLLPISESPTQASKSSRPQSKRER